MLATRIVTRSTIVVRLSGSILIDTVLPYCKSDMLTSEVHDEFVKAFHKDSYSIVKYNQVALKQFFSRVLDLSATDDFIKAVIEMCITKAIIIDCEL